MIKGVVVRVGGEDIGFECDDINFEDGRMHLSKDSDIIMIFNTFDFLTIIRE